MKLLNALYNALYYIGLGCIYLTPIAIAYMLYDQLRRDVRRRR